MTFIRLLLMLCCLISVHLIKAQKSQSSNDLPIISLNLENEQVYTFIAHAKDDVIYLAGKSGLFTLKVNQSPNEKSTSLKKLPYDLSDSLLYFDLLVDKKTESLFYATPKGKGITLHRLMLKDKTPKSHKSLTNWMNHYDLSRTTLVAIPQTQNIIAFNHTNGIKRFDLKKRYQTHRGDNQKSIKKLNSSDILSAPDALTISDNGKYIAAKEGEHIYLWAADGKLLEVIEASNVSKLVSFNPTGQYIFYEAKDHSLVKWDWATSKEVLRFQGHREAIVSLDQDKEGRIVTASLDHTIKLWSADGKLLKTYSEKNPKQVSFYNDLFIVSLNQSFKLKFWEIRK